MRSPGLRKAQLRASMPGPPQTLLIPRPRSCSNCSSTPALRTSRSILGQWYIALGTQLWACGAAGPPRMHCSVRWPQPPPYQEPRWVGGCRNHPRFRLNVHMGRNPSHKPQMALKVAIESTKIYKASAFVASFGLFPNCPLSTL